MMTPSDAVPADSNPETFAHVQNYMLTRGVASPIYAFLFNDTNVRLTHASRGLIKARLNLTDVHLNSSGSIHGGVSATIVDWAGGLVIASWDLRDVTGVSVDINITYISGAKLGEEVEIEGRAEKVGGSLAFTQIGIYRVGADGERADAIAVGRHTKFVKRR